MKKRIFSLRSLCALLLTLTIITSHFPVIPFTVNAADVGDEEPKIPALTLLENGTRYYAKAENIDFPTYVWYSATSIDGEFSLMPDVTTPYYDITVDDAGKFFKVTVGDLTATSTKATGNLVVMDIGEGAISFNKTYSGKDSNGNTVSGTHSANNVYLIVHSANTPETPKTTKNNIKFDGHHPDAPFDITLSGVNMYEAATNHAQKPGETGSSTPDEGQITIPAYGNTTAQKNVTFRLKGENCVRNITYYNAGDTTNPQTVTSSLKFTDINGDGATNGGALYIPYKMNEEQILNYVKTNTNHNHWNAGIGGIDSYSLVQNLTIAGGKIQVVTSLGDNCTAIGAGGNGYCQMTISGGEVIAHCNGTGAAIGGGIGWNSAGGRSDVTITGGKIYAKNHAQITSGTEIVGGVAIGSGSSFVSYGTKGKVTIEGGYVEAYGTFGNGIGGGNSSQQYGGSAEINISGGTVISNSIGGGNSKKGEGGSATLTINAPADITLQPDPKGTYTEAPCGIGGGLGGDTALSGQTNDGGDAKVTMNGGTLYSKGGFGGGNGRLNGQGGTAEITVYDGSITCLGTIGGGTGSGTGAGGVAKITVNDGTLTAADIGGGNAHENGTGDGGNAEITVNDGTINCSGVIGGGNGTSTGTGGEATVTVEKGYITAKSIGGGIGGTSGDGGPAKIVINGGTIETGSIGGGTSAGTGDLGYATADITGGNITGQFLMFAASEDPLAPHCYFKMTGGNLFGVDTSDNSKYTYSQANGAAIYMSDPYGLVDISGGTIRDCSAENGGAVYMTAGTFNLSGEAKLQNCDATQSGGAIYMLGGTMNISGGTIGGETIDLANTSQLDGGAVYLGGGTVNITECTVSGNSSQQNGGAFYLGGGTLDISGGTITKNTSTQDGGAAYVNGGTVYVAGGKLTDNTAGVNGGAIAVNNGKFYMIGGNVDRNRAETGSGGAIYVSADGQNVDAKVFSGSVSDNYAKISGGALAVVSDPEGTEEINVQIGVNKQHINADGTPVTPPCSHDDIDHIDGAETTNDPISCPVVNNNSADKSGGAIYVTGSKKAHLNIYCITEAGSKANGETEKGQSNFMKVEGGTVTITTSNTTDVNNQTTMYGNSSISSTVYVTGGDVDLYGDMMNPRIEDIITVDIIKEGDTFNDHRLHDTFYKIIYFENFIAPGAAEPTGQYKEDTVVKDGNKYIAPNIYTHQGYEIIGWNTAPDGSHTGPTPEHPEYGWYYPGNSYVFDGEQRGNLELWAIWKAIGYNVILYPNNPEGTDYMGPETYTQTMVFDQAENIDPNPYSIIGYNFLGWSKNPNATVIDYTDGQNVINLATEFSAGVAKDVKLYAIWEECDHNSDTHDYTYTVNGNVLKVECECGGYSRTATVTANGSVYTKDTENLARLTLEGEEWPLATIVYEKYDAGSSSFIPMEDGKHPVFAGTYRASISETYKGVTYTASLEYVIEKAPQPAPPTPKFTPYVDTETFTYSTLKVTPVTPSPVRTNDYENSKDCVAEYRVVYYDKNGAETSSEWKRLENGNETINFNINAILTTYFIYARYSEGENYSASPETPAESVYFFAGDIDVTVIPGEGITYIQTSATDSDNTLNGLRYDLVLDEGYFFPDNFEVTVTTSLKEGSEGGAAVIEDISASLGKPKNTVWNVTSIPKKSHILVTIGDAVQAPKLSAAITEKEEFGKVEKNEATISRDSAYTAYFSVEGYSTSVITSASIDFSQPLPKETNLILLDKLEKVYYWYNTSGSSPSSIPLSAFDRMGAKIEGDTNKFTPDSEYFSRTGGLLQLQLIVDFSDVESGISGELIKTSLKLDVADGFSSLADTLEANVDANLENVASFELNTKNEASAQSQSIIANYHPSKGITSKFDNRGSSLVLTYTGQNPLPEDVYLKYTVNRTNKTAPLSVIKDENGNITGYYFVLTLGTITEVFDVTATLSSGLFKNNSTEYPFNVKWLLAESIVSDAPMNGQLLGEGSVTFRSKYVPNPSVQITTTDSDRIFTLNDTPEVTVKYQDIPLSYSMKLTLMKKNDDGQYVSTAWTYDIEDDTYTTVDGEYVRYGLQTIRIPLQGHTAGSFAANVIVYEGLSLITEENLYFIVEDESSSSGGITDSNPAETTGPIQFEQEEPTN